MNSVIFPNTIEFFLKVFNDFEKKSFQKWIEAMTRNNFRVPHGILFKKILNS